MVFLGYLIINQIPLYILLFDKVYLYFDYMGPGYVGASYSF